MPLLSNLARVRQERAQREAELVPELRAWIESLERRLDDAQVELRQERQVAAAERARLLDQLTETQRALAAARDLDGLRAELTRLSARLDQLAAQPLQRPWPGLKMWWRRVWEGDG